MTEEEKRLKEAKLWRRFGPYLSERQWGTVREDYSLNGDAWNFIPHDHARSYAYRWGEEGIAGICDDKQLLCFALGMWNGVDPIIKERLFGLTGHEGNHGEDVKEYYFYLDNLPSHAYMKYLYKYPQKPYPYEELVAENRRRSRKEGEYELLDTGIFDRDEYFDVFVEYAKAEPEDILIQINIINRSSHPASLHLLPTLWLRNTWDWVSNSPKPTIELDRQEKKFHVLKATEKWLYCDVPNEFLFTENETNVKRLYGVDNKSPYVKDGINDYLIHGKKEAVNRANRGSKVSASYLLQFEPNQSTTILLRLNRNGSLKDPFGKEFASTFKKRIQEADAFYERVTPASVTDEMRGVQRQAFAGLLWNKQLYHYNVRRWLKGDPAQPPPPEARKEGRNHRWWHLDAYDIFSMPDKWEYPWFASWDLAFHTVTFSLIDPDFAKDQLLLLLREWYMHPNGQIPAYEWAFGDVNPPVHAWAALHIYQIESTVYGRKDVDFLKKIFHKLSLNFTWWVNRTDKEGKNIFEGGFLGLDNIGIFDRSKGTPLGGILEQCDGTGWMGMYCLNLLQMALELSQVDSSYEEMAVKFFEHFIYIADAIDSVGGQSGGLWDEAQGFYHGILKLPGQENVELCCDTIVGVVPLFAAIVADFQKTQNLSIYHKRFSWLVENRPELTKSVINRAKEKVLISLASPDKLKKILTKILDETAFFSPFGLRSVSAALKNNPFSIDLGGVNYSLDYEPAESTTSLFGGNSNWRGPIWFPMNYLFIESMQRYAEYLGPTFTVECPTGSGQQLSLNEVIQILSKRLINIFLRDEKGERPVYGKMKKFQTDPHFRDYILFHEYFHGDTGFGLGASNQTGWTALVAKLIHHYGTK